MIRIKTLFFIIIFSISNGYAQDGETMDLKECIEFAWKNNIQIRQTELNVRQSELSQKQAKFAPFPSLNASYRHGGNFGRSIDFTSYQYVSQATHSAQVGLNLNVPLYQGLQLRNRLKQSSVDLQASMKDLEQSKESIGLSIAQAYLSILLAEEQIAVLKEQTKVTQAQYERTLNLITAGTLPENSRFDLEAQTARDEQGIVNAENGLAMAYMNLKIMMNMELSKPLKIQKVEFVIPEEQTVWDVEQVYAEASANMPNIVAARMREESAEVGVRIAKGALYPSISAYGSLTSNFSSAARDRTIEQTTETINLTIAGIQVPVGFPSVRTVEGDITPYYKQMWDNLYTNVGVSINMPIFNGFQTRIAIERAELGVKIAQLNSKQVQIQLKSDVERAVLDVKAAQKSLAAAEKSLKATRASAENTRKRFEIGVVNGFELISVQNMLIASESTLLQAKYDYIFKLKVLDFYRGVKF